MPYVKTREYIQALNRDKFAGFNNWRLPTLEEAMSLMKPKKMNADLYIDPVFDTRQWCIWTVDRSPVGSREAWLVYFSSGSCNWFHIVSNNYVRAVRSEQSAKSD
jgi:hypothetical protein